MGMPVFGGSASHRVVDAMPERSGNPDPKRFKVTRAELVGSAVVVMARYPDCLNFEGSKILVYEDARDFEAASRSGVLDPHFQEGGGSPIARFRPTDDGWSLALAFAKMLVTRSGA